MAGTRLTVAALKTVGQESREIPDDPALPVLGEIKAEGLAASFPELDLTEEAVLKVCNYHPGSRATLEVRAGTRRIAIKIYSHDPTDEAEAYRLLAAKGLAKDSGPRVPRLLSCDHQGALALSWLDGTPANRLVKNGKGRRAGELAAEWLRAASKLDVTTGQPRGVGYILNRVGMSVNTLTAADATLGATAQRAAEMLAKAQPEKGTPTLVHGTMYARHIFDTGDGPGVIDFDNFGQGPVELDAGMFLATISRTGLRHREDADQAGQALESFLEGTRDLVHPDLLEWYWAACLLYLSGRGLETNARPTLGTSSFLAEAMFRAERLRNRIG